MKSVIVTLSEEVIIALAAGQVATIDGLVTFTTSLSGSFETPDMTITKKTAHLNINVQEDVALQAAVAARAEYSREILDIKVPIIKNFFDVASNTYDHYTAGSIIRLEGDNLKFNLDANDEGVFLTDASGTENRLTVYSATGNKQIDALLPAGLTDALTVTVRARYTDHGELRQSKYHRPIAPVVPLIAEPSG